MIHSIYTMSIGRYGRLDKTQDARLLRRWFNPLPVGLFRKRINKFFESVREALGGDGNDTELYDQLERVYMTNRMLLLSVLYDALYLLMITKAGVDMTLLLLNKEVQEPKNLDFFKEQTKELTGIEINNALDILKIRDELTRMKDKFAERFPDKPVDEQEKSTFYRGALSIFSLMEMPYNPDMTLSEFSELKHLADDRRKQLEKQLEKQHGAT